MLPRPLALALAVATALSAGIDAATAAPPQRGGRAGGPSGGRLGGPSQDGDGGELAGGVFGSAKARIGSDQRRDLLQGAETFDPKAFRAKIDELTAKTKARRLRLREMQSQMADDAQVQEWFQTCDHDGGGWLSFSETALAMGFDRGRFQAFDEDRDGRLDAFEFDGLYMHEVVTVGRFVPPKRRPGPRYAPIRTPIQLRNAYDTNVDRHIDVLELAHVVADYGRETSADVLLASLDSSADGRLSVEELGGVNGVLFPVDLSEPELVSVDPVRTVESLFGRIVPRGTEPGATPTPPLIVGPLNHFLRLDLDRDGFISLQDLEALLRPVRCTVRPQTVINTLDLDGDFRLSEAEFLGSLVPGER